MSLLRKIVDIQKGDHQFVNQVEAYTAQGNRVIFSCLTNKGQTVQVWFTICSPYVIRVQMYPDLSRLGEASVMEIKEDWESVAFTIEDLEESVLIKTAVVQVEVHKAHWQYTFKNQFGETLLREEVMDLDIGRDRRTLPLGVFLESEQPVGSSESYAMDLDEHFYGGGEKFTDLDKRGQQMHLWTRDAHGAGTEESYKNVPFFVSTKGYGLFWNTSYRNIWEFGTRSAFTISLLSEDPKFDLFFLYGPGMKTVLKRYAEITGFVPLLAKKAYGIQATVRWDEAEQVGWGFRNHNVPVDIFRITSPSQSWPDWEELLPDFREMVKTLERMHLKGTLYVSPYIPAGTRTDQEGREKGYMLKNADGSPFVTSIAFPPNYDGNSVPPDQTLQTLERSEEWYFKRCQRRRHPCTFPDLSNPEAFAWYKSLYKGIFEAGAFGIGMSDFGEDVPPQALYQNGRPGKEMHNIYPVLYNKAIFEACEQYGQYRGFVNGRSGYAGSQRYPICWSGDPNSTVEEFAANIRAGLCYGLSGVPFWSHDMCGYAGSKVTTEFYIRWMQFSMFCSHVRLHGAGTKPAWEWGPKHLEEYRRYALLRYRLLPYLYSCGYEAHQDGLPVIRAMALEFEKDPCTYKLDLQYMFGSELLVAPMVDLSEQRHIYLPAGNWFDFWDDTYYQGSTNLVYHAPLERLPLLVRSDSIIPMGPEIEWIEEKPFDAIEPHIWLMEEASYNLFDDDQGITNFRAKKEGANIMLEISASTRNYQVCFHLANRPESIQWNGQMLTERRADQQDNQPAWWFDPEKRYLWARFRAQNEATHLIIQQVP